jgi:flagellar biosynthetic protein FliO
VRFLLLSALMGALLPPDWAAAVQQVEESAVFSVGEAAFKMLAALGVVLAMMFFFYWLLRRLAPGRLLPGVGSGLKIRGRLSLGARKSLVLVEAGSALLLLGVGEKEITLLREIKDQEEIAQLRQTMGFSQFMGGGALRGKQKDEENPR